MTKNSVEEQSSVTNVCHMVMSLAQESCFAMVAEPSWEQWHVEGVIWPGMGSWQS